jgi:hypothetical protein
MTQPVQRNDDEETKANATQCRENRLHADTTHDVPQEQRAQHKCDRLGPRD